MAVVRILLLLAALISFGAVLVTSAKLPACKPTGYTSGQCIDNSKGTCCPQGTEFVDGDFCKGHSNKKNIVCCGRNGKTPAKKPAKGKTPAKKPGAKPKPGAKKPVPKPKPGAKPKTPVKSTKKPDAKKPGAKKPAAKKPAAKKPAGKKGPWSREDAFGVVSAWLKHKPMFAMYPKVKQYIKSGKGLYRPDCSGFVSACWNIPPPGSVTSTIKFKRIGRKALKRGDALLCNGCYNGIHHIGLFWGYAKDGRAVIVEEYNYGHPVSMRAWSNSWFMAFMPIRRPGWT
jgi:hypothetical protein